MKKRALILQNAMGEDHGILRPILFARGWEQRLVPLYQGASIPRDWRDFTLVVVMGGPMNVYEERKHPFLSGEMALLKGALATGPPVLGFCLGAQLMAKACEARVQKAPEREIGWHEVRLTGEGSADPCLMNAFPDACMVFQWHGDTFELPAGAVRLFTSEHIPNQAMRIGELNYAFQFHFEVTTEMIEDWLVTGRDEVESLGIEGLARRIRGRSPELLPLLHIRAQAFLQRYLARVEARML